MPAQPQSAVPVRDPHSNPADLAVPLCAATYIDSLASNGIVGWSDKGIIHPIRRYTPEAEFSDEARRLRKDENQELNFDVMIGLVVDSNGKPQDVCLRRSVGYGLDANAAKAVEQYQFDPAKKNGKPVAERITIEVNLHLYR